MNAVGVAVKRRRITADRGREFLEQLAVMEFPATDNPPHVRDFVRLHDLATMHQLTSYERSVSRSRKAPVSALATRARRS